VPFCPLPLPSTVHSILQLAAQAHYTPFSTYTTKEEYTKTLVIMKYFAAALPLAASLVAAQNSNMQVMSLAPAAPSGAATHTVSIQAILPHDLN
jgi:hypothetical protein